MKLNAILFSLLILFSSAAMANGPWVEKEAPQEFPAEVFVYPNPSNGVFYVELQSIDLLQADLKVVSLIAKR